MFEGMTAITFPSTNGTTPVLPFYPPFNSPSPPSTQFVKMTPGLCKEYLVEQRPGRVEQEETSNRTKQTRPGISSEVASTLLRHTVF